MKKYKLGILVGRFQVIHSGHKMMIDTALELCERVGVFIGSSNESRTNKNPFTYEERKDMLMQVFGDRIEIFPLPDIGVGNNSKWGEYVLDNAEEHFGFLPDILVSGEEGRRNSWFDGERGESIEELFIPKTIDISASEMRGYILNNNFEEWKKYSDEALWDKFEDMRSILAKSCDNKETTSI